MSRDRVCVVGGIVERDAKLPDEVERVPEPFGCTVCIRACPVDAIIGARKWMHAVLESECTGCGLCVEPCPVDCIAMVPARTGPATPEAWLAERAPSPGAASNAGARGNPCSTPRRTAGSGRRGSTRSTR